MMDFSLKLMIKTSTVAGVGYLIKNLLTNSENKALNLKEPLNEKKIEEIIHHPHY